MAYITQDYLKLPGAEVLQLDDECFYCGLPLTLPCVYWHGHGKAISLHEHCARVLGVHLKHHPNHEEFESWNQKQ
jgi:hypothetical protein